MVDRLVATIQADERVRGVYVQAEANGVAVTSLAGSPRVTEVQATALAALAAELTASWGTQFATGAAWSAGDDDLASTRERATAAMRLALARGDTTPIFWDDERHGPLLRRVGPHAPVDPPAGWIQRRWARWSDRHSTGAGAVLIAASYALGLLLPFTIYSVAWWGFGVDLIDWVFWVVFVILAITTGVLFGEALLAIEPGQTPPEPERWPSATALVPAWLPNERDQIIDTVQCLLELEYPGDLRVICAYNTNDEDHSDIEAQLAAIAAIDHRLLVMRVDGSGTKAQNLNAALAVVTSDMVAVFDADHQPNRDALRRAATWIAEGWEGVQGRCTVRLGDRPNRMQRLVAVEFETIYGVTHSGRARRDRFAIFGGSNGYWRTSTLRALRFASDRLTEDIDVSARALLAGARIATDRTIVSSELPPADVSGFWGQRGRWAQGWTQVSHRWLGPILRAPRLSFRQKLGATVLFGLREVTPWLTLQMYPILLFNALSGSRHRVVWLFPAFVISTVLSLSVVAVQAGIAWAWADPRHRRRSEYLRYVAHNVMWLSEFKMLISRVAQLRAALGETSWRVTRRAPGARSTHTDTATPLARPELLVG